MRPFLYLTVISAIVFYPTTSFAGIPMTVEMTCPVGGEKFTFIDTTSSSSWGSRPDGKPYGSWVFPMPLPECPGNGLVLYRDFSADEIERLESLLETPDFLKIKDEPTYYRVAWLMRALGKEDQVTVYRILNMASWQVDRNPEKKEQYQQEFAEGVAGLPAQPEALDWIILQSRAANAWRELGQFDRAKQVITSLPLASLDVPIPAEVVDKERSTGLGKSILNYAEISAAKRRRGYLYYLAGLSKLIERRDRSSEPLDMIPVREAARKCLSSVRSTSDLDAYCENEKIQKEIQFFEKTRNRNRAEKK